MKNQKIIIAYVPVIHQGYIDFFKSHKDIKKAYILSEKQIKMLDYLRKDIRSLDSTQALQSLNSLGLPQQFSLLSEAKIQEIIDQKYTIIAPQEDIIQEFIKVNLNKNKILYKSVFLRWDKYNTVQQSLVTKVATTSASYHIKFMKQAYQSAEKSSDWWRQVGAVIVKDNKVVASSYNQHMPTQHTPYINCDPRNTQKAGKNINLCSSIHAEASCIAECARQGICLEKASMYATTFACPVCARLVSASGIKKFYFTQGYSALDAQEIFQAYSVELTQVIMDLPDHPSILKKYPK